MALTPREREAMDLVAVGLTNREIGERMGIECVSAKTHVWNAMKKFGCNNRCAAAAHIWQARVAALERENANLRRAWDELERYADLCEQRRKATTKGCRWLG